MAVLKAREVKNMDEKTRRERLKSLKMELVKANVSANKTNAKTKEIKKAIARIKTRDRVAKFRKEEVKSNK